MTFHRPVPAAFLELTRDLAEDADEARCGRW